MLSTNQWQIKIFTLSTTCKDIPESFNMAQINFTEHLTNSWSSATFSWRHDRLHREQFLYRVLSIRLAWPRFVRIEILLFVDKLRWLVTSSSKRIPVTHFRYPTNSGLANTQFVSLRNCCHGSISGGFA